MQVTRGIHWHGRHERGLNNPGPSQVAKWRRHMEANAALIASIPARVINASRETALTCFERMSLEEALAC